MVTNLNTINYQDNIDNTKVALVKFWASWCGPCKAYAPVFDKFSEENSDVSCFSVDCEESPNLASDLNVVSIPATALYVNGEFKGIRSGKLTDQQLKEFIA